MIQLAHAATGALAGRASDGPVAALHAGIAMHAAMDVIPHGEVHDDAFEAATGVASLLAIAARYGVRSPVTWGAAGSLLPDLEHVLPSVIRPARAIFPTHRWGWLHGWETKPLAIPAWLQAMAGGAVIGALVALRRSRVPDAS